MLPVPVIAVCADGRYERITFICYSDPNARGEGSIKGEHDGGKVIRD
jgi:hypothetical protein